MRSLPQIGGEGNRGCAHLEMRISKALEGASDLGIEKSLNNSDYWYIFFNDLSRSSMAL